MLYKCSITFTLTDAVFNFLYLLTFSWLRSDKAGFFSQISQSRISEISGAGLLYSPGIFVSLTQQCQFTEGFAELIAIIYVNQHLPKVLLIRSTCTKMATRQAMYWTNKDS